MASSPAESSCPEASQTERFGDAETNRAPTAVSSGGQQHEEDPTRTISLPCSSRMSATRTTIGGQVQSESAFVTAGQSSSCQHSSSSPWTMWHQSHQCWPSS